MCRAIILDNLLERELRTKKCITEDEAKTEAQEAIKKLSKKFKVEVSSGRFEFTCIELD